jgi:hypothetical protein
VKVLQALFEHLRKEGLDPDTFARIKDAAIPRKLEHPGQQRRWPTTTGVR